jgi:hypothetical protein
VSARRCCADASVSALAASFPNRETTRFGPLNARYIRFAQRPLAAVHIQLLLGAQGVDWQLQRTVSIGRPAKLVIDQAESPVAQKIDPIGLSLR